MEENLRFKIDGASLTVRSKFTGFVACERETFRETFLNSDERRETSAVRRLPFLLCFTLYLRAIFQVQAPGGLCLEERFNRGFFALSVWGLIFEGAYTWRGLFSEFYGIDCA